MNKIIVTLCLILLVGLGIMRAQGESGLSELNKLKAENFKLKAQLTQCQVAVNNGVLTKEQTDLVEIFRKELGAKDEEVFDWNTLTFKSVPKK